jgi:hypothetical protein
MSYLHQLLDTFQELEKKGTVPVVLGDAERPGGT